MEDLILKDKWVGMVTVMFSNALPRKRIFNCIVLHLSLHYVFSINLVQLAVLYKVSNIPWYDKFACGVQCLLFITCCIGLSKLCTVRDCQEILPILPVT
jgi:hypothetical protein